MVTNYSRHDTLKGNKTLGLPICLALAAGLLYGIAKYGTNHNPNISHYNSIQEIRAVQSQRGLENLADKYRRGR